MRVLPPGSECERQNTRKTRKSGSMPIFSTLNGAVPLTAPFLCFSQAPRGSRFLRKLAPCGRGGCAAPLAALEDKVSFVLD